MRKEAGFTLIELLVVTAMTASLVVLSSFAVQRFAQRQQLDGTHDAIVTQLRQIQGRAVAVSHPSVFGAWFATGGGSDWGPVEYIPDDPETVPDETNCLPRGERDFDSGQFDSGDITVVDVVAATDSLASYCSSRIPEADAIILFYPRGDATEAQITIRHDRLDLCRTIYVLSMTGRVQPEDGGC